MNQEQVIVTESKGHLKKAVINRVKYLNKIKVKSAHLIWELGKMTTFGVSFNGMMEVGGSLRGM